MTSSHQTGIALPEEDLARKRSSGMGVLAGWAIFAGLLLGGLFALYEQRSGLPGEVGPPLTIRSYPATVSPATPDRTTVRHPLPQALAQGALTHRGEGGSDDSLLTLLASSDEPIRRALASLLDGAAFERFFLTEDIVRRLVVAIDNIPRERVPSRLTPTRPTPGWLLTNRNGEELTMSEANAARYEPFVRLVDRIDAGRLVHLYARFYSLFQRQYEELGYPNSYFNDRVVDAIDVLLSTPQLPDPLEVVQSKVLYEFADPDLEALPAGQKAMLRLGSLNAERVKVKLLAIRRLIADR